MDELPAGITKETEAANSLSRVIEEHILAVYASLDQNKDTTAKALGIARSTLYRKLKEYGVE